MIGCCMRTTIDLKPRHHQALTVLAARRGLKGFSTLVEEAVDAYLESVDDEEADALLSLEGVLDDEEADELDRRVGELRGRWRTAS